MNIFKSDDGINALFQKQNIIYFFVYLAIYLLIYGFFACRFGFVYDEAREFGQETTKTYLCSNRWGLYYYRVLWGEGTCQWIAGLMAGCFISVSLLIQVQLFKLRQHWQKVCYGMLYLSGLQWMYQLQFCVQSDAVALGLLFNTIAAVLVMKKPTICSNIIAIVLVGISVSFYQSIILHFATLFVALLLSDLISENKTPSLITVFRGAAAAVLGIVLWVIMAKIAYAISDIPVADVSYTSGYTTAKKFSEHNIVREFNIWWTPINALVIAPVKAFTQSILSVSPWYGLIVIPVGCLLAIIIQAKQTFYFKLCGLCLIIAALAIPYEMLRVHPLRIYVAAPLSFSALWAVLFPLMESKQCHRTILCTIIISFCLMLKAAYVCNGMASYEAYSYNRSLTMLQDMNMRGTLVANAANTPDCPIYVLGTLPHPDAPANDYIATYKVDNTESDKPTPHMLFQKGGLTIYAKHARYPRIQTYWGSREKVEDLANIPMWPNHGSVVAHGDAVYIKVSEFIDDLPTAEELGN